MIRVKIQRIAAHGSQPIEQTTLMNLPERMIKTYQSYSSQQCWFIIYQNKQKKKKTHNVNSLFQTFAAMQAGWYNHQANGDTHSSSTNIKEGYLNLMAKH